jgi:hypothetical protein
MRQTFKAKQASTVDSLVKELTELKIQVATLRAKPRVPSTPQSNLKTPHGKSKSTAEHDGEPSYCWTHGIKGHSSSECKNPREGHMAAASNRNRMGGAIPNPSA